MKILNAVLRSALFVGFAFMGSSLSCSLFDKVDDVSFEVDLEHTFVITEDLESDSPVTYAEGDSWDPKDEPEFDKYKDKIKEITVNSVTYTVSDYQAEGDVVFSNGTGKFKATAGSATALASAGINIQSVQGAQGSVHELSYAISDLNAIADQLEEIDPIFFEVGGTFSHTPVYFKVNVKINCTITAEAL
jgi:hypothetical protein